MNSTFNTTTRREERLKAYFLDVMKVKEIRLKCVSRSGRGQETEIYRVEGVRNNRSRVYVVKISGYCRKEEEQALSEMRIRSDYFPVLYHAGIFEGKKILIMDACIPVREMFRKLNRDEYGMFIRKLLCETVYGLMDLAETGRIHSDIKTDNLVYIPRNGEGSTSMQGHFGMIDLGSAVNLGDPLDSYTKAYAPDMEKYHWRAVHVLDTYGLGVTAYELLTGMSFSKERSEKKLRKDMEDVLSGSEEDQAVLNIILRALNEEYRDLMTLLKDLKGKAFRKANSLTTLSTLSTVCRRNETETTRLIEPRKQEKKKSKVVRTGCLILGLGVACILLITGKMQERNGVEKAESISSQEQVQIEEKGDGVPEHNEIERQTESFQGENHNTADESRAEMNEESKAANAMETYALKKESDKEEPEKTTKEETGNETKQKTDSEIKTDTTKNKKNGSGNTGSSGKKATAKETTKETTQEQVKKADTKKKEESGNTEKQETKKDESTESTESKEKTTEHVDPEKEIGKYINSICSITPGDSLFNDDGNMEADLPKGTGTVVEHSVKYDYTSYHYEEHTRTEQWIEQ